MQSESATRADTATAQSAPPIAANGAYWCPDCRRSKQFLGEHQIPYRWIDIEQDAEAEQFVIETNQGKRIIPTLVFADGSHLVEPSNADLARKLGFKSTARRWLMAANGPPALRRGNRDCWRRVCPGASRPAMCATAAPSR